MQFQEVNVKGKHKIHRCPECLEFTTEKCFCRPCRDKRKKPPMKSRNSARYYFTEHSHAAGRFL